MDMPKTSSATFFNNSDNENVVNIDYACSSKRQIWVIIGYVWQVFLLLSASMLAFLSRDVMEEMNESQCVGFLTYSHLMFLILRIVVRGLWSNGSILGSVASSSLSMILCLDVIVGAVIYFGPKFFKILTENSSGSKFKTSGLAGARSQSSGGENANLSGVAALRKAGVRAIKSLSSSLRQLASKRSLNVNA